MAAEGDNGVGDPIPFPDPCTGNHPHTHQGPHDRGGADSGPHPDAAARQHPRWGWRGGKGRPAPAVDGSAWPWPDPVGGSLLPAASPAGKASAPPEVGGETNQAVLAAYGYLQRLLPWGGQENARLEELARKAKFSQHRLTEKERGRPRRWYSGRRDGWTPHFRSGSGWPSAICGACSDAPKLTLPNFLKLRFEIRPVSGYNQTSN